MNEIQVLARKRKLKAQGLRLIRDEIIDLDIRLCCLRLKQCLEQKMTEDFDPELSRKLDCINFLLRD